MVKVAISLIPEGLHLPVVHINDPVWLLELARDTTAFNGNLGSLGDHNDVEEEKY